MTGADIDRWTAEGGSANAARMLDGWRKTGWPGPLDAENETVIEWAYYCEALGSEAADARVSLTVEEGDEGLLYRRQMAALAYVRRRAHEEARARTEADRDA